jgi:hypothetical protein
MKGQGRYGFKVDNYSCGIVLMEILRRQGVMGSTLNTIITYAKLGQIEPGIREKMPVDAVALIERLI